MVQRASQREGEIGYAVFKRFLMSPGNPVTGNAWLLRGIASELYFEFAPCEATGAGMRSVNSSKNANPSKNGDANKNKRR